VKLDPSKFVIVKNQVKNLSTEKVADIFMKEKSSFIERMQEVSALNQFGSMRINESNFGGMQVDGQNEEYKGDKEESPSRIERIEDATRNSFKIFHQKNETHLKLTRRRKGAKLSKEDKEYCRKIIKNNWRFRNLIMREYKLSYSTCKRLVSDSPKPFENQKYSHDGKRELE
jgi:uncharacterized protein (DUF488 family)